MDVVGVVFLVLIAVAIVTVAVMAIASASDIRRYLHILEM